ncbi:bifunctional helix-turn-helix transcriptional regulator/GNAT family N-acetyltransferase [Caballeronia sp. SEWSISQ10-4 2]|uniref:bifunctional helix-turn-helix transcriptional regulator/GNAT family N-acetyltransferase n=1 Tax=Caballeronia sp. SEWSISQ10-4 2 TaxID=2937438 RepID=UPI00264DC5AF|nr:bifunctional helix-turn-helix transcriptional regulator/GNAT family N-acetyltransferase [Caballeronia sp. SEWSISQ10-4 2]MDN7177617.1 bifunctional helix-turn-helix transcriptional regulator/GNAT family N-acetyltransferase [Caballeronia sp. SEWSISQ10-4 2]
MVSSSSDSLTDAVRRFQWFYACHVRAPHELVEHSALSLMEMRVLFAVIHAGTCTAADISRTLGLDTGYLSRMLTQFERSGLIERRPFAADARSNQVSLTAAGEAGLTAASTHVRDDVSATLDAMTQGERTQLIASMGCVQRLLSPPSNAPQVQLRGPRPGDFGWIVEREAQLAPGGIQGQREQETHTAMVVADYLTAPDPLRNACWVAEQDDISVGASLLIGVSGRSARLAALFVEPGARRAGIARQLIKSCMAFASESGYDRIVGVFAQNSDTVVPLLRQFGFEELRDNAGWEKRLKEHGVAAYD